MNNPEVLIIPDIHGRTFWKDAIKKFPIEEYPNLQIIFLGDYLDPYTGYEPITQEQAFNNFREILRLKDKDSRVTLLIGNHDLHYFVAFDTCRIDYNRENEIKNIFVNNMQMFNLHKIIELDNCKYLFTHAGISQGWLNEIARQAQSKAMLFSDLASSNYKWLIELSNINTTYNFDLLEECLHTYQDSRYTFPLLMVSDLRGGGHEYGSLIWADVHEHLYSEDIKGFYQIFGHTRTFPNGQKSYAISLNNHCWAMLDASQAFIMDIEGNIESLN